MKKLSIYSFLFKNGTDCFLFNTETLIKAKISHDLYENLTTNKLSQIDDGILKVLEEKKIIVDEKDLYDFYYKMEIETNRINYDMSNMTLFLIPTINCNFCCPYCFEGKKEDSSMDNTTIQNIINLLNNSSANKLSYIGMEANHCCVLI